MWKYLERRLVQAEISAAALSWADWQAAFQRQSLRVCVELHELVRDCFRIMGIDRALTMALRRGEEAATELAAIPDIPDLTAAGEATCAPTTAMRTTGWADSGQILRGWRSNTVAASPGQIS